MSVRLQNAFKQLLLVLFSLVIGLLVLELCIRIYSGVAFPKMMVLDQKLGWKHAVNVAKIFRNEYGEEALVVQNSYGHRGKFYSVPREKNKYRILVLGDSFTEGSQVNEEDLFSAYLERKNPDMEVINAGVGGYGTVQEYLYLASDGLTLAPDLVLLMVYENDPADNCLSYDPGVGLRPYAVLNNREVQIIEELHPEEFLKFLPPVPFRLFLHSHSYLFYFLNSKVYQVLRESQMRKLATEDLRKTDGCRRYEVFAGIVTKMSRLLSSKRIDFAMVLIPSRKDVVRGSSDILKPILDLCQEQSLKCLSLLNRFVRETAAGANPYFQFDIHWTKTGHQIDADEIDSFLSLRRHRLQRHSGDHGPRVE